MIAEKGHFGHIIRATLVDNAIADGSMYKSKGWEYAKEAWVHGGTLHFIGLLSDGGVHSRYNQLKHLNHHLKLLQEDVVPFNISNISYPSIP